MGFNLFKAQPGKVLKDVIVKRDGKTFRRKQWVRQSEASPEAKSSISPVRAQMHKIARAPNIEQAVSKLSNEEMIAQLKDARKYSESAFKVQSGMRKGQFDRAKAQVYLVDYAKDVKARIGE